MTWDTGGWGDSPWGGLVGTSPTVPRPHLFPGVHLTIDGHPVKLEPGWSATEGPGGYDRFSASVPLAHIRRHSLGQEAQAILYDDSAEVIWYGTLSQDPAVAGDVAFIEAEGPQAEAQRDAQRLLFQTRSLDVWQDRLSDPFLFGTERNYDTTSNPTHLMFKAPRGEDFASGHADGFAMWSPGTPGGIQRYAFTIKRNRDQAGQDLRSQRFTGPSGSRTTVTTHGLDLGESLTISQAVTGGEDGLDLSIVADATFTQGQTMICRLFSLRANGIWGNTGRAANYDTMYVDEGVKDVFGRLGWGTTGLTQNDTNVLPTDWEGGPFLDLLDYFTLLVDYVWLAPVVPGGDAIFRPWGFAEHRVRRTGAVNVDLEKLRAFNEVVVPYTGVGGAPREAVATPTVDPLPGVTRTFYADELADEQPNSTLADAVGAVLAPRLAAPRWRGRIDMADGNPYRVHFGDHIIEEDAGPAESRTHRVMTIEKRYDGVSVGIEGDVTAGGLIGLNAVSSQRRVVRGRGPKKRQRKKTRQVRQKMTRRIRRERREFVQDLSPGLSPHKRRKRIRRWDRQNPLPVD